jgi:hypothetical protein
MAIDLQAEDGRPLDSGEQQMIRRQMLPQIRQMLRDRGFSAENIRLRSKPGEHGVFVLNVTLKETLHERTL